METSQGEQRESGSGWDDRPAVTGLPEAAVARNSGTVAERDVSAATGTTGGDRETGRRNAQVGHSNGGRSVYPASGVTNSAKALGPDILRPQLRLPTETLSAASGTTGAAVYCRRVSLGGRSGSGEIFRPGQSRPTAGGGSRASVRQKDAEVDTSISGSGHYGGWVGERRG